MLQLTAWRLSSDSPVRPASLLRWLDSLSSVGDSPHAWIIKLDGVLIGSGVETSVIGRPLLPSPRLLISWLICSSTKGLPSLPSKDIGLCYQRFSNFRFRRSLLLLILKDLIWSFEISAPRPLFPSSNLGIWIRFCSFSQALHLSPLREHLFWIRPRRPCSFLPWRLLNGFRSLQALSFSVSFQGEDLVLYYDPFFRAKTESAANPLPRSVIVPSSFGLCWWPAREGPVPCQSN